jgi:hypothetical protein
LRRIRTGAVWSVAAGCVAGLVAIFWFAPSPDNSMPISDVQVFGVFPDGQPEGLPVYRIAVNETTVRFHAGLPKKVPARTIRIDFKLNGQPVTFWVWDSPSPRDD